MAKNRFPTLLLLLALGLPAAAQEPHFGIGLALSVPTGAYNSTTYAPNSGTTTTPSTESYDSTLGAQFTISFPMDPKLALRLDLYGQSTSGRDTAPGYATYNLEHDLYSLGGEAQVFPGNGDAYRHRGAYLVGGLSMDLEQFSSSYGDPNWTGYSINKTRMGGLVGAGYSFRPWGWWRSNVEVAYHKTLSGYNTTNQPTSDSPGTPPADFLRFTYGFVF
jgi:hypothetical protein